MVNSYQHIAYLDTQKGKHTILILHGWMQNKESWDPVVSILKKHHRIIIPDLPGFGVSQDEAFLSFSPIDYAKIIIDLLDHLDVKQVTILAHSFGGRIALVLTSTQPQMVDKLILFSIPFTKSISKTLFVFKRLYIYCGASLGKKIKSLDLIKKKLQSRDYKQAGALKNIFLQAITFDTKPYMQYLHLPTLIIWGENDAELPIKDALVLKKYLPHAKLTILKAYGHFAHRESPQLFAHTVISFLENEKV